MAVSHLIPPLEPGAFVLDLCGVDLRRADLSCRRLVGADLTGANLSRANLSRADLSQADLCGANLSQARLDHAVLDHAEWNTATIWPAPVNAWIRSIGAWDVPSDATGDERRLPQVGPYLTKGGAGRRRGRRRANPGLTARSPTPGSPSEDSPPLPAPEHP
ncbi:pentapeptide repeat-containing protein [Nonomuraea sp. NPDC050394]|uniref:pentapeptide repeat-containing protein n=1 Tax=Nonomuraea sp. NPDC050394 TaxID=3364363 RepID=UPI00379B6C89